MQIIALSQGEPGLHCGSMSYEPKRVESRQVDEAQIWHGEPGVTCARQHTHGNGPFFRLACQRREC